MRHIHLCNHVHCNYWLLALATLKINLVICSAGLGCAVGALAPTVDVPFVVMFAIGLGIVVGGIFRALSQIQSQLKHMTPPS